MKRMVLDIGGTAVKSAVYEDGALLDLRETPTEASLGGAHVVALAKEIIASYRERYELDSIGISTAGQVNSLDGTIIYANQNIPGYTGTPLKQIMEEEFHLPTFVENDVNAAALGELRFGAGRGESAFVCLTYGTGVGGAIVLNGSLYSGSSFSAGEFGAILTHPEDATPAVDPFLGGYEKYASTTALVQRALAVDPALKNGRKIFESLDRPEVRAVVDAWILEIVYGLATITHMLNPSCLILGGGVMEQDYVLQQVESKLSLYLMPSFAHVKVRRASLGNRAGLLGASVLGS